MPTIRQVILRIAAIIAVAEFAAMLLLEYLPYAPGTLGEALIDVAMLSMISIPMIYFWVIKPFVQVRDAALAQISHLANTDPLTELFNRRHLLEHLHRTISSCSRNKFIGALILIDLDGFKPVNDTYGHDAGDVVLVTIAKRFLAAMRAEELVCRLGGDEFIVLVNYLSEDENDARKNAQSIAEKLIGEASQPIRHENHELVVGASAGICLIRGDQQAAATILRNADVALYKAKEAGKGHAQLFD